MNNEQIEEARAFLADLSENSPQLPYEPQILPGLFAASREGSSASIIDLTVLIESSPNLAAKILSVANSSLYALECTVTSLQRAISVLGFREVRNIALMLGAASFLKAAKLPQRFDFLAFWRHELQTAAVARTVVSTLNGAACVHSTEKKGVLCISPDEAYAIGLLHDMGKVFLALRCPRIWYAIEELGRTENLSFTEAENLYWGMDHALIGAQVMHYWRIPLKLTDPINWHHAPSMAPSFVPEAKLLAAADILANEGLDEKGGLPEAAFAMMPEGVDPVKMALALHPVLSGDLAGFFEEFAG
ncbi:MAG: HDOD domain-containing protein [Desulfovibrio sp.]|jgi:HD-like signal output (HDOD) protein|nr:HDOD domain-containing protein [Desulfovibrio sp.]